jgi:hypothetical protein
MLAGREDTWVDGFVDWLEVVKGGVDEQAIAEYAAQLRQPGHTRASFEYFRTMHADVAETIHHRDAPRVLSDRGGVLSTLTAGPRRITVVMSFTEAGATAFGEFRAESRAVLGSLIDVLRGRSRAWPPRVPE